MRRSTYQRRTERREAKRKRHDVPGGDWVRNCSDCGMVHMNIYSKSQRWIIYCNTCEANYVNKNQK